MLEHDLTGQKKLSALLLFCFDTLDTFGKEPEQLANVDKLFQFALKGYTVHQVESAFKQYIKSKTTMPKPADIIQIIEPTPQEKQWCKVTFLEIKRKKRENVFTTDEENKYIEDFVQAQVTAPADRRLELQNAVKQAQVDDKRYWLT